ncbi:type II toxin-antitoxin system VapC family toxin [Meiothermus granaticius]|uniref:Ribonuclease VapC n=1 Tax=Meiothermus granaticius NBRC 107808 TaxID=1227551 RepID=A0A399F918_9DEIN|nr:type II toxin-antitoxin system VapC family toxin [Meiothermus granaticius]RIH93144.1 tRNA(fMet)-specific endonuclease VapC [Meiothermus granaticius NBRC 107808]GEM88446.1 PIN domain-containing protein [Meiothermus granaticius NBRC 107808]
MTSLDTSVLLTALDSSDPQQARAQQAILKAAASSPLLICPPVYAELRASAYWESQIEPFLSATGIRTAWEMPEPVWARAGQALGQYARLRRGGQLPRRILADFLIAAHAEHHRLAVLTFDTTVLKAVFPEVVLLKP